VIAPRPSNGESAKRFFCNSRISAFFLSGFSSFFASSVFAGGVSFDGAFFSGGLAFSALGAPSSLSSRLAS